MKWSEPTRRIYQQMRYRCENPSNADYPSYGGRGIKVCERWRESFDNFLADMGRQPEGLVLDREDNDGPYDPSNCRWVTPAVSARNTRRNVRLTHNGQTHCLADWAAMTGIGRMTLTQRLASGWSVDRALSTPLRAKQDR
jgi:hypothetical protein